MSEKEKNSVRWKCHNYFCLRLYHFDFYLAINEFGFRRI